MPEQTTAENPARPASRRIAPGLIVIGLFLLAAWPLILTGFVKGRGAHDQLNYHEQVIRTFAEQWPHPDYADYLSATTPGYHTLLAAVARSITDERWALQLAGSLFTIALLALAARGARKAPAAERLFLLLPLAASMPIFYAGVWLLPDNAGWLGVLAIWMLALRPRFDARMLLGGGAILATLVYFRQIHIWSLAMLLAAGWIGSSDRTDGPFDLAADLRALLAAPARRLGRIALVLFAALPAIAVLAWFWRLWGDLTPPVFHERHVGGNPVAPAFVLAVFGMVSVFFVPFLIGGLRLLWVRHTWLLALALAIGAAAALIPPTTYSFYDGRYSGLWNLARAAPAPMGRSVVVVPLTILGALLLAAWFVLLARRDRWIMLGAFVAFTAAQCASFQLWQRYNEPFVLLWLMLAASRIPPAPSAAAAGWRTVGLGALTLLLAAMTAASIISARPVKTRELIAPWETEAPLLPGMVPRHPLPPDRDDDPGPEGRSD